LKITTALQQTRKYNKFDVTF